MVGRPASADNAAATSRVGDGPDGEHQTTMRREETMRTKHRVASLTAALAMCLVTVGVSAAVAPSAGAAGSNSLTVKAGEYTYKFSGSAKAGWTQITFDNSGIEVHMMAVFP